MVNKTVNRLSSGASYSEALNLLQEKTKKYYSERVEDVYREVADRWGNNKQMIEWAEGEEERFEADLNSDLMQIEVAMKFMEENKNFPYPGKLELYSIYRLQWDMINLRWEVTY